MINLLGVNRLDETQVVDYLRCFRKQFAHPRPALAVLRVLEYRRSNRETGLRRRHPSQPLSVADRGGQVGPAPFLEHRLIVKQFQGGGSAGLEQIDDSLGGRREMGKARKSSRDRSIGLQVPAQQLGQRGDADTRAGPPKKWRRVSIVSYSFVDHP